MIAYISLLLAISGLLINTGPVSEIQRNAATYGGNNNVNAATIGTNLVETASDSIVTTSGPIEMASDSIVTASELVVTASDSVRMTAGTLGEANITSPPQTYEEWRNFLLAWNNMTLDDLKNADPITIQTLDQQAHIYEGWMNGTYTEEQASQLFAEIHQTPTVEYLSIPSATDGNFEYSFHVYNLIFGEHTFRVYVYMAYEMLALPANVFSDWSSEKVYGPYEYADRYPYDTLPYLPETDPSTNFMGSSYDLIGSYYGEHGLSMEEYTGSKHGLEIGDHHLVVQILYRGDKFIPGTFTYKAHFFWATYTFDVTIIDDDITPPVINGIYIAPNPHSLGPIPDSQEFFVLALDVTDASGIEPVILFNGVPCYASYYSSDWCEFYVPSPRTPGIHFGVVLVWDADYDRPGDRLFMLGACSYFIFDDDVNPPEVSWWATIIGGSGDKIQLSFTVDATDARGIGSVLIQIGDYTFNTLGTHTVTLSPGLYTLYISVIDADWDWQGDCMKTEIVVLIVLDLSPPTTELILTPHFSDETGCYVTSTTEYTLRATDDVTGVAQTYYRINGGDWIPYTTVFKLSGPEGAHTISYYSIDHNGNVEPFRTQIVVIDNTAPVTSLTPSGVHGLGDWYVSDVEVTLASTDGLSGVAQTLYSRDGSNWLTYYEPFAVGCEGTTTLYYRSIDNLGNTEGVKTEIVKIDWAAPETAISLSGTEGLGDWYVSDVTVSLSATDITSGVAKIMYSFDGETWFTYYYASYSTTLTAEVAHPHGYYWIDASILLDGELKDSMGSAVSGETINIYVRTRQVDWTDWIYVTSCTTNQNGHWVTFLAANFLYPQPGYFVYDAMFKAEYVGSATYDASSAETDYITIEYDPDAPIIIGSVNTPATASLSATGAMTFFGSPGPFTITDEGLTTIYYFSVDAAGNQGDQKTATIKIDKTAPETTESHSGTEGPGGWYTSDVTVTLEAADPVPGSGAARIEYSYDEENWMTYTSFLTVTSEGSTTIYYRSVDIAGKTETAQSVEIRIDMTPPTTTSSLDGERGLNDWFIGQVTITLSATDSFSGFSYTEYSVDNGPWLAYKGSFTIGTEGTTTIYYRSVDLAGNMEANKARTISIDKTKPLTSASLSGTQGLQDWYVGDVDVSLTATDVFSGVRYTEYSYDGIGWTTYTGAFTIDKEGLTTVFYRSVDEAGNIEDAGYVTIRIDTMCPETTAILSGALGNNGWYVSNVLITMEATDHVPGSNAVTIQYSFGQNDWSPYAGAILIATEGPTTIYYRAFDFAGNIEAEKTTTISIDKTKPVTSRSLSGTQGLRGWFITDVTVTLTAQDQTPGSGLAFTEYSLDNITWTLYEAPFIISHRDITTVYYRSADNAGNIGATESVEVKICIVAQTTIGPNTLNLKSKGQWVTVYIQLPEGYNANEIDVSSLELRFGDRVIHASWGEVQDGILMVKFDRAALISMLSDTQPNTQVQLEIWGEVADWVFAGTVTIRVI